MSMPGWGAAAGTAGSGPWALSGTLELVLTGAELRRVGAAFGGEADEAALDVVEAARGAGDEDDEALTRGRGAGIQIGGRDLVATIPPDGRAQPCTEQLFVAPMANPMAAAEMT